MFYVVRTKDFKRVIAKLMRAIQEKNRTQGTQYEVKVYGLGIETFEGVDFRKEELIRDIKEGKEVVYIFRNFCPLEVDEYEGFVLVKEASKDNPLPEGDYLDKVKEVYHAILRDKQRGESENL
ncbi:MAG: hypothetical protein ACK42C_00085 [Aquificaceae bacterium]